MSTILLLYDTQKEIYTVDYSIWKLIAESDNVSIQNKVNFSVEIYSKYDLRYR